MTKEDRDRAQSRADKAARAAEDARSGKAERDAAAKAVLDNMAKLKALRSASALLPVSGRCPFACVPCSVHSLHTRRY